MTEHATLVSVSVTSKRHFMHHRHAGVLTVLPGRFCVQPVTETAKYKILRGLVPLMTSHSVIMCAFKSLLPCWAKTTLGKVLEANRRQLK